MEKVAIKKPVRLPVIKIEKNVINIKGSRFFIFCLLFSIRNTISIKFKYEAQKLGLRYIPPNRLSKEKDWVAIEVTNSAALDAGESPNG